MDEGDGLRMGYGWVGSDGGGGGWKGYGLGKGQQSSSHLMSKDTRGW